MRHDWSTFGSTLKEHRQARGVTQRALAEAVGLDFTYISKIEHGTQPPPSEASIKKMAELLNADADELIRRSGKLPSDLGAFILSDPQLVRDLRGLQQERDVAVPWKPVEEAAS